MKSWHKTALLTLALIAVSVPLKFAVPQVVPSETLEFPAKERATRDFLAAQGLSPVQTKALRATWRSWSASSAQCHATVLDDFSMGEADDAVQEAARAQQETARYIYRGQISAAAPKIRIRVDQVVSRLLWPLHPAGWRAPLLVVLLEPRDCDALEQLPWSRLWQNQA